MKKYQSELWNIIAQHAADNMDLKDVRQSHFDDVWGWASGMTDKELEEECKNRSIDIAPYLNTGEDI